MQYLLNKGTFKFGTTAKADQFNPYHQVLKFNNNNSLLMTFKTEEANYSQIEKEYQAEKQNLSLLLHS